VAVIWAEPEAPVTGVMVIVRFDPLPPKVIPLFATTDPLFDVPLSVKLPASTSLTVTFIVNGVLMAVLWFPIALNWAGSFTEVTVSAIFWTVVVVPSDREKVMVDDPF